MNQKALDYLKNNPKVAEFLTKVNAERAEHYKNWESQKGKTDLTIEVGNKFIRFGMVQLVGDLSVELMVI